MLEGLSVGRSRGVREMYPVVMSLKNLVRTGWMLRGVPPSIGETVASHTFEVVFLSMLVADRLRSAGAEVDVGKVLKMALLHDVPEAVEGDIVKWSKDRIGGAASSLDAEAMAAVGLREYAHLVEEVEALGSIEAEIVKLSDNLATMLQAMRYLRAGFPAVKEIRDSCEEVVKEALKSFPRLPKYRSVVEAVINDVVAQERRYLEHSSNSFKASSNAESTSATLSRQPSLR